MNKPTFKEQSEKIIQAYLKCEIKPYNACACFVGNLLNKTGDWIFGRMSEISIGIETEQAWSIEKVEAGEMLSMAIISVKEQSNDLYTLEEVLQMERNFMRIITAHVSEDSLFDAMVSTLEMLKQIHISKGEVIEEEITLQKRTNEKIYR